MQIHVFEIVPFARLSHKVRFDYILSYFSVFLLHKCQGNLKNLIYHLKFDVKPLKIIFSFIQNYFLKKIEDVTCSSYIFFLYFEPQFYSCLMNLRSNEFTLVLELDISSPPDKESEIFLLITQGSIMGHLSFQPLYQEIR